MTAGQVDMLLAEDKTAPLRAQAPLELPPTAAEDLQEFITFSQLHSREQR